MSVALSVRMRPDLSVRESDLFVALKLCYAAARRCLFVALKLCHEALFWRVSSVWFVRVLACASACYVLTSEYHILQDAPVEGYRSWAASYWGLPQCLRFVRES